MQSFRNLPELNENLELLFPCDVINNLIKSMAMGHPYLEEYFEVLWVKDIRTLRKLLPK